MMNKTTDKNSLKKWLFRGFLWSIYMYLLMAILFPIAIGEELESKKLWIGIPVWLSGGFLFALINRYFSLRNERKKEH